MKENNRVRKKSKIKIKLWRAVEKEMKTKNCRAEYAKQTSWNVCEQSGRQAVKYRHKKTRYTIFFL